MSRHAEAETLAAFIEGELQGEELASVNEHLQTCDECRAMIREAVAFEREERGKPRRNWLPIAAGVAIAVIGAAAFLPRYLHDRQVASDFKEFFASTAGAGRPADVRFSGEEIYGRYTLFRGAGENDDSTISPRDTAADKLAQDTQDDQSPRGRRAYAIANVALNKRQEAVKAIDSIPPNRRDAAAWNDVAAVHYAANDFPGALAAADKALQLQHDMPEALFNRALALEQIKGRRNDAIATWKRYIAVAPAGQWNDEAKTKLDRLIELQ